jgi:hypothetical protein
VIEYLAGVATSAVVVLAALLATRDWELRAAQLRGRGVTRRPRASSLDGWVPDDAAAGTPEVMRPPSCS